MIVRIVKMEFREDKVKEFTGFFELRKETIRNFPGCTGLELLQDSKNENILFTYSTWESETALNHYRYSAFFKDTWGQAKAMFAGKPEAWSLNPLG
jgi:quinol monooxygenase YgiN